MDLPENAREYEWIRLVPNAADLALPGVPAVLEYFVHYAAAEYGGVVVSPIEVEVLDAAEASQSGHAVPDAGKLWTAKCWVVWPPSLEYRALDPVVWPNGEES